MLVTGASLVASESAIGYHLKMWIVSLFEVQVRKAALSHSKARL